MTTMLSLLRTNFILNGHKFVGFSNDGDALMIQQDVELVQVTRGADGRMIASQTGIRGGRITTKMQANSPTVRFLMQQVEQLRRGGIVVWNGSSAYENGVTVRLENGVITNAPLGYTQGAGPTANMTFVFEFESISPNFDAGRFTGLPEVVAA